MSDLLDQAVSRCIGEDAKGYSTDIVKAWSLVEYVNDCGNKKIREDFARALPKNPFGLKGKTLATAICTAFVSVSV